MSNINEKAIDRLNHLIAITNDGKYGYENAAEDVKDVTLKQMFMYNRRGSCYKSLY